MKRIIIDILLFVSIYFLPWWVSVLFAFALLIYLPFFIEGVFAVILINSLYSPTLFHVQGMYFFIALILFIFTPIIKKRLLV